MAGLKSNNNKALGPWTSVPFLPKLGYYDSGNKWYYPLIKPTATLTWGGYIYSYDRSVGDTFGIGLSGTKYVVPNKRVAAVTYDIPAGTYSPSAFKNLIDKYISQNGSRRVSNSFKVTVNGQTITVNANTTIYNVNNLSSGSGAVSYAVNFSGSYMNEGNVFAINTANSFTGNKVYITQSTGISYFGRYMYYNITISTGIKFK